MDAESGVPIPEAAGTAASSLPVSAHLSPHPSRGLQVRLLRRQRTALILRRTDQSVHCPAYEPQRPGAGLPAGRIPPALWGRPAALGRRLSSLGHRLRQLSFPASGRIMTFSSCWPQAGEPPSFSRTNRLHPSEANRPWVALEADSLAVNCTSRHWQYPAAARGPLFAPAVSASAVAVGSKMRPVRPAIARFWSETPQANTTFPAPLLWRPNIPSPGG